MNKQFVEKRPLTEQLHAGDSSAFARYQQKAVGDVSLATLLRYELAMLLFANLGGAAGYLLRKQIYRPLFRRAGAGLILGRGIGLRHPKRIDIGDSVAIDDHTLLDGGAAAAGGIRIGDDVIISRNCVIQAKSGPVTIEARADIGFNTSLSSVAGIRLGESVLVAGHCYIGGGRYLHDRLDLAIADQGVYSEGPIEIGEGSWLGAGATVLDGVTIGKGCIVGAGSVVIRDLPDYSVAVGMPAKVIRSRSDRAFAEK